MYFNNFIRDINKLSKVSTKHCYDVALRSTLSIHSSVEHSMETPQ